MGSCKIWKFGDDIDTDQIISSQYIMLPTIDEMKQYTFECIDADFASRFESGGVIVAGKNFGCGSSREQAPLVLRELGVTAVIAGSFARIFFRNSINIGLPLVVCQSLYNAVRSSDFLNISFEKGIIHHNERHFNFQQFPEHILKIIKHRGLINFINAGEM